MSKKAALNHRLEEAATLRLAGRFADALKVLRSIEADPGATLLGHKTTLGLPRRLHSAYLKLAKAESDAVRKVGLQYNLVPPPATLGKYASFTLDERKLITRMNRESVPKKIHQIWIGSQPAPAATAAWQSHATTHFYEYQLWNEASLESLGVPENSVYRQMLSKGDLPGAVDIARYIILQRFGGVYLDCDWYPVRNDVCFHDILPMTGLVTMPEEVPRYTGKGSLLLANSFIAAPPDHPVFARLISAVADVISELPKAPAWWATGPLLFTLMARGGSVTLADADMVAGQLPQGTPLSEVKQWCQQTRLHHSGLLLAWRSWER